MKSDYGIVLFGGWAAIINTEQNWFGINSPTKNEVYPALQLQRMDKMIICL